MKFKDKIKKLRLDNNLTQEDLAKERYKNNYATVNNEELIRVALKVNKDETAVGYLKKVVNDSNVSYEYVY